MTADRPPRFKKGQVLKADHLNQLADSSLIGVGGTQGIDASTVGGKGVLSPRLPPRPPTYSLLQLVIVSDQGDYLICNTLDASDVQGSSNIYVFKPYLLRRTPFDGQTKNGVSYVYSNNATRVAGGTETQVITQDYYAGAVIYAGLMNVSKSAGGRYTRLIDMNVDARAWCEEPD